MADVGGPLTGTAGNDFLQGDARDLGLNGVDNYGNSGLAALLGLAGDDILVGDVYSIWGNDTEGDELRGGDGNDLIFGDTAPDLSAYGIFSQWVGDPLWATNPLGSSDNLFGDAGNDTIHGGGGGDQINGGTGKDRLFGEAGGDSIYGDEGSDIIDCGDGNDTSYGGSGADTIKGGAGDDGLYGEAFSTSAGDGGDLIRGGDGADDVRGGAGADFLYGDAGNDRIMGGGLWSNASNDLGDFCFGGAGDDVISGDFGGDQITGGTGFDDLTGGDGEDLFIYTQTKESIRRTADLIRDFASGIDQIDVSAIDAIFGGGDDAFSFRGARRFTDVGQVRVYASEFDTVIDFNTAGDFAPEMRIILKGAVSISALDFIL